VFSATSSFVAVISRIELEDSSALLASDSTFWAIWWSWLVVSCIARVVCSTAAV
jgi:hypothetical protein